MKILSHVNKNIWTIWDMSCCCMRSKLTSMGISQYFEFHSINTVCLTSNFLMLLFQVRFFFVNLVFYLVRNAWCKAEWCFQLIFGSVATANLVYIVYAKCFQSIQRYRLWTLLILPYYGYKKTYQTFSWDFQRWFLKNSLCLGFGVFLSF